MYQYKEDRGAALKALCCTMKTKDIFVFKLHLLQNCCSYSCGVGVLKLVFAFGVNVTEQSTASVVKRVVIRIFMCMLQ